MQTTDPFDLRPTKRRAETGDSKGGFLIEEDEKMVPRQAKKNIVHYPGMTTLVFSGHLTISARRDASSLFP